MPQPYELYTCGLWTAKAGKEQEFIDAWTSFARWTSANMPGSDTGYLLQDSKDPRQFISFGGWAGLEAVGAWRSRPEFQAFVERTKALLADFRPQTMKLVATSGR